MVPDLGLVVLLITLAISLLQGFLPLYSVVRQHTTLIRMVRPLCFLQWLASSAVVGILIYHFVLDDLSLGYVAEHSNTHLPLVFKIAASWHCYEGSLLFGMFVLSTCAALFAWHNPDVHLLSHRVCAVLSVIGALCAIFILFILFYANPFHTLISTDISSSPLFDGHQPLLIPQFWIKATHFPLLLLGYGALVFCFALVIGALISDGFTQKTAADCLRWVQPAWILLTASMIVGSWWAYCEQGNALEWLWNVAKNTALLPWLTTSALLHSLQHYRNVGGLAHCSVLLVIITFILILLSGLIVHSGVLVSLPALTQHTERALPLLLLFTTLSLVALSIYGMCAGSIDVSNVQPRTFRSYMLLGCLSLFVIATLVVAIGLFYPTLDGSLKWRRISAQSSYFPFIFIPLAVLALLGIVVVNLHTIDDGTPLHIWLLAWGCLLLVAMMSTVAIGLFAAIPITLCCGLVLLLLLRDPRFPSIFSPMLLAHSGVLLSALGIGMSVAYSQEATFSLRPGEYAQLAGYQLHYRSLNLLTAENYIAEQANIVVTRGARSVAELSPELRRYVHRDVFSAAPAIKWSGIDSWHVLIEEKKDHNQFVFRFYHKPFISWIGAGALLMIVAVIWSRIRLRYRQK